ncbi:MAG: hypothetical protein Q9M89_05320 [Persephonella sp.]|nr:hypothetical protein [Persephonella sp.]
MDAVLKLEISDDDLTDESRVQDKVNQLKTVLGENYEVYYEYDHYRR